MAPRTLARHIRRVLHDSTRKGGLVMAIQTLLCRRIWNVRWRLEGRRSPLQVAGIAVLWQSPRRQSRPVAGRTLQTDVRAHQGKPCGIVVEARGYLRK